MPNKNRYYRGPGYHVDSSVAEYFADKYLSENGRLTNTDSPEFKADLEVFLFSHCAVEEAYVTAETEQLLNSVREVEGALI